MNIEETSTWSKVLHTQCVVNLRGLANTLHLNATYIWVLKFYRLIRSTKMSGDTFPVAKGVYRVDSSFAGSHRQQAF